LGDVKIRIEAPLQGRAIAQVPINACIKNMKLKLDWFHPMKQISLGS
jgi:hypothetical protein